jgi:hypothetical protein
MIKRLAGALTKKILISESITSYIQPSNKIGTTEKMQSALQGIRVEIIEGSLFNTGEIWTSTEPSLII